MTLYHYTCEKGRAGIEASNFMIRPSAGLVWLTDLETPVRRALGLTMRLVTCDRTTHRFLVPRPFAVERWVDVRRSYPRAYRDALEDADGVLPMHWFVSEKEQSAVYAPVTAETKGTSWLGKQ